MVEIKAFIDFEPPKENRGQLLSNFLNDMTALRAEGASPEELMARQEEHLAQIVESNLLQYEREAFTTLETPSLAEQRQTLEALDKIASTPEGCKLLNDALANSPDGKIHIYNRPDPGYCNGAS